MIVDLSKQHPLSVTPDLFRGPGATRQSRSLTPWIPDQVRDDTEYEAIHPEHLPV